MCPYQLSVLAKSEYKSLQAEITFLCTCRGFVSKPALVDSIYDPFHPEVASDLNFPINVLNFSHVLRLSRGKIWFQRFDLCNFLDILQLCLIIIPILGSMHVVFIDTVTGVPLTASTHYCCQCNLINAVMGQ